MVTLSDDIDLNTKIVALVASGVIDWRFAAIPAIHIDLEIGPSLGKGVVSHCLIHLRLIGRRGCVAIAAIRKTTAEAIPQTGQSVATVKASGMPPLRGKVEAVTYPASSLARYAAVAASS